MSACPSSPIALLAERSEAAPDVEDLAADAPAGEDLLESPSLIGEHRHIRDRRCAVSDRDGDIDQYPSRIVPGPGLAQNRQLITATAGRRGQAILVEAGLPEVVAGVLADVDQGIARGELDASSDQLEQLLGRVPVTIAEAVAAAQHEGTDLAPEDASPAARGAG